jgi:glycosyltransferase involved in cell wall biosynthesis
VLTLHEAEPFMPATQIPKALLLWWRVTRRLSVRRASRILTVSEAARQDLVRYMRVCGSRIHVVHLGVDLERFSREQPPASAQVESRPYLLWVGRPYPRKDLNTLLGAFARLAETGRPERLVLVGPPGWKESELRQTIRRSFKPGRVLRSPPAWDELPAWYANASAFVFPSRQETFGLPVLEAMAAGTPVVSSDIAALREVAAEAAVYVKPGRPAELAHAIETLLADQQLRDSMRQRGLQRASVFDWRTTAQKTCEHLTAVGE